MKSITTVFGALLCISATAFAAQQVDSRKIYPAKKSMYNKGWVDFNKNGKKDVYEDPSQPVDKRIDDLIRQMTLEEKSCQLATYYGYNKVLKDSMPTAQWKNMIFKDGIANIDEQLNREVKVPSKLAESLTEIQRFFVEQTRLGIPVDFTNEGIRGLVEAGATSFPSMNGLGCTWDTLMAYREGRVVGQEARAVGYTNVYAPILDVARDQRWGRCDGSIAEDPYLVARMGVAMARGLQEEHVVSTPKHFVGYGDCKGARQWDARTDPHITPSEMYYIHEYPFRKVFQEAGALGVMCCYADYNGVPMAANHHYLTDVLRGEMGFKGYVVSDSYAIGRLAHIHHVAADNKEACQLAVNAGLNVRTDFTTPDEYIHNVRANVKEGKISEAQLNKMVRDVLYVKFWLGLFDHPYSASPKTADKIVSNQEHMDIALQASRECLVLLKNKDNILPLGDSYHHIAVIGPNANASNYVSTHYGPSDYKGFVSVYQGLKKIYADRKDITVDYAKGIEIVSKGWPENELIRDTLSSAEQKMVKEAVDLAKKSDVVVAVLGDGPQTSGESRTRTSLDLPGHQEELLEALVKTGKPVVLVLMWGRPATINYAQKYCPAILAAGYPGAQAGTAVAEALKGDYNPGGKLANTWPVSVGQLPMNVPTKPNANYEEMRYHTVGNKGLLYCFGHGLSYTTFAYSHLKIDSVQTSTGHVTVSFDVTNTGKVAGDEVPQLYITDVISSTTTYEQNLRGFTRLHLNPGETQTVTFPIRPDDLIMINANGDRVVEPGEFKVRIGSSYSDIRLTDSFFVGKQTVIKQATDTEKEHQIMNDSQMK